MSRSLPIFIRNLFTLADDLDVKVPADTITALNNAVAVIDQLDELHTSTQDVAGAVYRAVLNGKDPLTDPEVERVTKLTAIASQPIYARAMEHASANLVETVQAEGDTLVAAFQPRFDSAAQAVADARPVFKAAGIDTLDASDQIARAGLDVARANLAAREGNATMTRINQGLGMVLSAGTNHVRGITATIDPKPGTTRIGLENQALLAGSRSSMSVWTATDNGHTVSLATSDQIAERNERMEAAEYQQQADYDRSLSQAAMGVYR
ncbi:hypothetical protein [Frigoribacterium sp. Leaf172]|uniref:hypothetical protein n=1 Tax=Frigoribacterium sp. Leaf172 TaxID=1736285 RepID=UPI0006F1C754|nr:hypothetical protein [Frigoribacterium sp. Leaf172]KQR64577.1 hypothetical protein ASF89_08820 [Frigoribacterium sp. Leaf172]